MPEDLNITAARDIENAIRHQRTANAIIARAITTAPDAPCRCSLCRKASAARPTASLSRNPHVWKLSELAKSPNGHFYAYLTPADGVAVKVDSARAEDVLRIANAIENMEVADA